MTDLSAIVVNWNTRELLASCLRSLDAYPAAGMTAEAVVVDNGSTDGSAAMTRSAFPEAVLIANEGNAGYTRANNQAIRVSNGRYLLLINTDAELTPHCLDHMVARMEADPRVGAVGPRLVFGDGSWQRWTAGRAPSIASAAAYFLFWDRTRAGATAGVYLGQDLQEPVSCDWVSSACMLLRRSALDEVGLLDEALFCYMDDVDICQRLRDAGWSVWYEPRAEAIHLMGQTTVRKTGVASPTALRNFNAYYARRHGVAAQVALRGIEVAGFGMRAAAYALRGVIRNRRPEPMAAAHWRHLKLCLEVRRAHST
ncbi:MAG: hypothetical protein NVSMB32_08080 [Actinomycetota bacterium]